MSTRKEKQKSPRLTIITPTIRPQYLHLTLETLRQQTFRDFEHIVVEGDPANGFTLPKDYNDAIRRAKGDIIVSLQDCISVPDDFLYRITQLDHTKAWTFPVVKKGTGGDWRLHRDGPVSDTEWEIDLACAPRQLFYDVGGFDESYCNGWSYDNVEIGIRAAAAGWEFRCDNTLVGYAIDHDALIAHPFRKRLISNQWRVEYTRREAENGDWKLDHLI